MSDRPDPWRLSKRTRAWLDYQLLGRREPEPWQRAAVFLSIEHSLDPHVIASRVVWAEAVRDAFLAKREAASVDAGGLPYVVLFCAYARSIGIEVDVEIGPGVIRSLLSGEVDRVGRADVAALLRRVADEQISLVGSG